MVLNRDMDMPSACVHCERYLGACPYMDFGNYQTERNPNCPLAEVDEEGWIPVSSGNLPTDRELVLVTAYWHENYQVMQASYFGDGLWWCVPWNNTGEHMQALKPVAWKPQPQAYRPPNK